MPNAPGLGKMPAMTPGLAPEVRFAKEYHRSPVSHGRPQVRLRRELRPRDEPDYRGHGGHGLCGCNSSSFERSGSFSLFYNEPAVVQFLPGSFALWNSGTTPTTLLAKSASQRIIGAGAGSPAAGGGTSITLVSGSQTTGLIVASTTAYTNATAISQLRPNRSRNQYFRVGNDHRSTVTAYAGATGSQVTGIYLLAAGDTLTPTYAGGTPTMDSSLPVRSGRPKGAPTVESLYINLNAKVWATIIDLSFSPTGGAGAGAYAESAKNPRIYNVR